MHRAHQRGAPAFSKSAPNLDKTRPHGVGTLRVQELGSFSIFLVISFLKETFLLMGELCNGILIFGFLYTLYMFSILILLNYEIMHIFSNFPFSMIT